MRQSKGGGPVREVRESDRRGMEASLRAWLTQSPGPAPELERTRGEDRGLEEEREERVAPGRDRSQGRSAGRGSGQSGESHESSERCPDDAGT